jgi:hypothetical protein
MSQFTSTWLQQYETRTRTRLPDPQPRERKKELARDCPGETPGAGCPLVRFILYRVRLLDVDAKYASVKDLLDGLQHAGLIHGDQEGQVRLDVQQKKVGRYAEEQTIIEIEYADPETSG